MPWFTVAAIAAPYVIGAITGSGNKRSASSEVPGMEQYVQQSLQGQKNAQTYADAAVDPNSAWFRNLSALFREQEESTAIRGIRAGEVRQQRMRARGIPQAFVSDPERRDERADPTRLFRDAAFNSRNAAMQALLNASGKSAATMGDPNKAFQLFKDYGSLEANRRGEQASQFGKTFDSILGLAKNYNWNGNRFDNGLSAAYGQSANMGGLAW
jgi:hypothetical protein